MPSHSHRCRRAHAMLVLACLVAIPTGAVSAHVRNTPQPTNVEALAACPVDGSSEFVDDWGDRRSGGRQHQGVDMVAERGTPVLAVSAGQAEFKRSNLGGNAIWLISATGERFYYAHLDRWAGSSRAVVAGEVIGYVGSSGNARGDHLHFESYAGKSPVNPYPLADEACRPSSDNAPAALASRAMLR